MEQLEKRWRDQGAPIADALEPGLTPAAIAALTEPLGITLPGEVARWWAWHNGAGLERPHSREIGGPGFRYISLEEAVQKYHALRVVAKRSVTQGVEGAPEFGELDFWWNRQWFPIVESVGGISLACDCTVAFEAATPIRAVDWSAREPGDASVARSFGQVIEWWIAAFDAGAWRYDRAAQQWDYRFGQIPPELALTRCV